MRALLGSRAKARAALAVCLFLFSFAYIRVYNAHQIFLIFNQGDDLGFTIYTEALLQNGNLDWCHVPDRPYFCRTEADGTQTRVYNKYPPGAALMSAPFTLLGWGLHKTGIYTPGTGAPDPSTLDPIQFWTIVASFFLFLGGMLLLYELTFSWIGEAALSFWLTLLFGAGNLVLYYVFRRPLMSHAAEFFCFFAALYVLNRCRRAERVVWPGLLIGFFLGAMTISRLNSVYVGGIVGILVLFDSAVPLERRFRKLVAIGAGAALPFALYFDTNFVQRGSFLTTAANYDPLSEKGLYFRFMVSNPRRIFDFLLGPHWGGLWLMPVLLVEAVFILVCFPALRERLRKYRVPAALLAALTLFQLNMQANYPSNSMSYGYRYLLTQWCSLHLLFLLAVRYGYPRFRVTRPWLVALAIGAVLGSFNLLNFESNGDTLTLLPHPLLEEGIYDPDWSGRVMLAGPNYVAYSLRETLTGRALKNLVAAPMVAYPLLAFQNTPLAKLPGYASALEYYHSKKRGVAGLSSLTLLVQYQLWCLLILTSLLGTAAWYSKRR